MEILDLKVSEQQILWNSFHNEKLELRIVSKNSEDSDVKKNYSQGSCSVAARALELQLVLGVQCGLPVTGCAIVSNKPNLSEPYNLLHTESVKNTINIFKRAFKNVAKKSDSI